MAVRRYDRESVNRAFAHHRAAGLIRSFNAFDDATWSVTPWGIEDEVRLRSLREARLFVVALASAAQSGKMRAVEEDVV